MSRLFESELSGSEEHIVPCDCGDRDYLRFSWDKDEDFRYLWIESVTECRNWKQRFALLWSIVRGKRYVNTEILLAESVATGLKDFFNSHEWKN